MSVFHKHVPHMSSKQCLSCRGLDCARYGDKNGQLYGVFHRGKKDENVNLSVTKSEKSVDQFLGEVHNDQ